MNQLNSIILEGNVVKQPELTEPCSGFKVCKFTIAVNRFFKKESGEAVEEVSFFDVESYGKSAEVCQSNLTKGRGVRVVGRLKQNRWKDTDGKNHSKVFVMSEHIEFKPVFDNSEEKKASKKEAVTEKIPEQVVF